MIPPKNRAFGIDHPVITARNFMQVRTNFEKFGFAPNPLGYHPWGTVCSLMMFENNFIELIGIDDPKKFGIGSVNGFCYGRHHNDFLQRSEGLSLVSLHSKDIPADYQGALARGIKGQGEIHFRRKMVNPDGTPGEAVVSLGMLLDDELGDVSNFLCHQHRPELVWIKEWQDHPNGANGVRAVTYIAEDPSVLEKRWTGLYGERSVFEILGGIAVETGAGELRAIDESEAKARYRKIGMPKSYTHAPHGIAITVSVPDLGKLEDILGKNKVPHEETEHGIAIYPEECGNVILEFVE